MKDPDYAENDGKLLKNYPTRFLIKTRVDGLMG